MKRVIACWVAMAGLGVSPQIANASAIESAHFEIHEEEFALQLTASGELGDPLVRTEAGNIRVWFPHVEDNVRLDPNPDGDAIRSIRIRPGFGDTSVVLFRVGNGITVPVSAVRVERSGDRGTIFIRRDAVPAPSGPPAVEAAAEAPVHEETTPGEISQEETSQEEISEEDISEQALLAEPPPEIAEPAEAPPASRPDPERRSDSVAAVTEPLTADASPDMGTLLIVSLLLGAAYCGVKLVTRKAGKRPLDDIQIVSSKRLGTRHQIVLVRALGEDHLLSINGAQTHCISSTPSVADEALRSPEESEEAPTGVIARIQDRFYFRPRIADNDVEPKPPKRRSQGKSVEPNRFGAELLRFALASEKKPPQIPARPRGRRRGESEAVAGLVKLRERLAQSA